MPEPGDQELAKLEHRLRRMPYPDAADGVELHNFMGRKVLECKTTAGQLVAVKVSDPGTIKQSEADMMHYAATNGVLAPKILGFYNILNTTAEKPLATAMVSERVPGVPLVNLWLDLSEAEQTSIKTQLRTQLARMRSCTQPYIGRVHHQPAWCAYERLTETYCGPFSTETEFDAWCLARLGRARGPMVRWKWARILARERKNEHLLDEQSAAGAGAGAADCFVLTHGDLTPRNIMVQDGAITGIVDWERSGFFPAYAEYAYAMESCPMHEDWWMPVLKEVLQPCSDQRLEFTRLIQRW